MANSTTNKGDKFKFFKRLVRGRQSEFVVYSQLHKVSLELMKDGLYLNIYDQVSDIDGIDFLLRCEAPGKLVFMEGQVKTATGGRLNYGDLEYAVERSLRLASCLLVFAVDYTRDGTQPAVYFYTANDLKQAHERVKSLSFGLGRLNELLGRDTSISKLPDYFRKLMDANAIHPLRRAAG